MSEWEKQQGGRRSSGESSRMHKLAKTETRSAGGPEETARPTGNTNVVNNMEGWEHVERIYTSTTDLVVKIGIWGMGSEVQSPRIPMVVEEAKTS